MELFFFRTIYLSGDNVDGCSEYGHSKSPEYSSEVLLCWLTLHQVEASEVRNQGSDRHLCRDRGSEYNGNHNDICVTCISQILKAIFLFFVTGTSGGKRPGGRATTTTPVMPRPATKILHRPQWSLNVRKSL